MFPCVDYREKEKLVTWCADGVGEWGPRTSPNNVNTDSAAFLN